MYRRIAAHGSEKGAEMKVSVYALSRSALDYAITSIEEPDEIRYGVDDWIAMRNHKVKHGEFINRYSGTWSQGGPIIDRERIDLFFMGDHWVAVYGDKKRVGNTALIAAMRVYVAVKLADERDEIDIPAELVE